MNDIQVEGRYRGSREDSGRHSHHDERDVALSEPLQDLSESGAAH